LQEELEDEEPPNSPVRESHSGKCEFDALWDASTSARQRLLYKKSLRLSFVARGRPGERGNLPSAILMFVNAGAGDRGTL
jgi:hypothetical protein